MRNLAALPLLVSFIVGCSVDGPTAPRSARFPHATAASAGAGNVSRPMSGQCDLTTLATVPYPAPPVFRQTVTGTCTLTHLGRAAVRFVQVVNFATRTQQSLELAYIAPNGDVLNAASAGTNAPIAGGVSFSATITFAGGTGRFANATGQAHATGRANVAEGTSQYALDGWISYDASAVAAQ